MSRLYGVGVGPGDPELMTLKAVRVIRESDVIIVPGEEAGKSVAYQIAAKAVPEIADKKVVAVPMPMTKDPDVLRHNHESASSCVMRYLDEGCDVAFLTLGDPCVYSTYLYVHHMVQQAGYSVEIISGITSFCAAAARLNLGLAEKSEEIHILPASYQIEEGIRLPGTKILMKSGRQMKRVKELLAASGQEVCMVENCGMAEEKVYERVEDIPDEAGYYSLIIVKEKL